MSSVGAIASPITVIIGIAAMHATTRTDTVQPSSFDPIRASIDRPSLLLVNVWVPTSVASFCFEISYWGLWWPDGFSG